MHSIVQYTGKSSFHNESKTLLQLVLQDQSYPSQNKKFLNSNRLKTNLSQAFYFDSQHQWTPSTPNPLSSWGGLIGRKLLP